MEEKGLDSWDYKSNEEKVKEVEAEFGEDVVDAEVVEEGKEMEKEEEKGESTVKKYKDMTKEEQRELNIDILLGIGFQRSKKNQNQFIYIEGETLIGKTFDEKNPVGSQFWGFKDKNKLTNGDITELPIIKSFYAIREGKEEMPEKKEIVIREPTTVERKIMEGNFKVRGGFYPVSGKQEPDAWTVQQWANSSGVSIEVRETTQTREFAKATVRAYLDKQFADETVIHFFDVSKEVLAYEIIAKMYEEHKQPIEGYDDEGKPILTAEAKGRIYKRFIRFQNFSIRDAISKASRRATLKIINKDWREPAEIEAEEQEVKAVQEEK